MTSRGPQGGIRQGWSWLAWALDQARRYPSVFPLMGLLVALISWVPLLGSLFLLFAGPALIAGTVLAARDAEAGKSPDVRQLFTALVTPGLRGEAFKLCIPLVAAKLLAGMLVGVVLTVKLLRSGIRPEQLDGHPEKLVAMMFSQAMLPWWCVALGLVLLAWSFVALAIPQVALRKQAAFPAMLDSLRRIWRRPLPWLGLLAVLFTLGWLLWLVTTPVWTQLGVYVALYALLGPSLYAAWRDQAGTPTRDDNPPPPPRPQGVLKA